MLKESILNELEKLEKKLEELSHLISTSKDSVKVATLCREYKETSELIELIKKYKVLLERAKEDKRILEEENDKELKELASVELEEIEKNIEETEKDLLVKLFGDKKENDRAVIVEIRAGTGGEEAALFAADLFRMYVAYAEKNGWKLEIISFTPTDLGGYKEVIFGLEGEYVYGKMKFESGVHRVQRIPITESGGRIHTSAASVAVLPRPEKFEINIDPSELKIETMRAGGHGGQHVNRTESAVRITHIPTGIVAISQDERSQQQNREKAMRVLESRLYALKRQKLESELHNTRKKQIGTGDRSEKIRTYNFPQNRVTDHRAGITFYNLEDVLKGELDELHKALIKHEMELILERKKDEILSHNPTLLS